MKYSFNEEDVKKLKEASGIVEKFNDFGLEVWLKRLNQYQNDTVDIPSNLLFRQILEAGDGIVELIRIGCINTCKPLLRMTLDCYLQLAFVLENDNEKEKKAFHFLYHYNKKKLQSLESVLFPANENSLSKKLKYDSVMSEFVLNEKEQEMGLSDHKILVDILNSDENKVIRSEYGDKLKKAWYQFFIGTSKMEDLAKKLNRSAMYEIPFRQMSSFIHGEDIVHINMEFYEPNIVGIKGLRDISMLRIVFINTVIILRRSILLFIQAKLKSDKDLLIKLKSIDDLRKEFEKSQS